MKKKIVLGLILVTMLCLTTGCFAKKQSPEEIDKEFVEIFKKILNYNSKYAYNTPVKIPDLYKGTVVKYEKQILDIIKHESLLLDYSKIFLRKGISNLKEYQAQHGLSLRIRSDVLNKYADKNSIKRDSLINEMIQGNYIDQEGWINKKKLLSNNFQLGNDIRLLSNIKREELSESAAFRWGDFSLYRIDINNDGKKDNVVSYENGIPEGSKAGEEIIFVADNKLTKIDMKMSQFFLGDRKRTIKTSHSDLPAYVYDKREYVLTFFWTYKNRVYLAQRKHYSNIYRLYVFDRLNINELFEVDTNTLGE